MRPYYLPLTILLIVLIVSSNGLWYYQLHTLEKQTATKESDLITAQQSVQQALERSNEKINELQDTIDELEDDNDDLRDDLRDEKNRNETFEDQIKDIAGTVGTLDKLSKIDEEILQKYSRVSFLNENYIPSNLSKIRDRYVLEGKDDQYFHGNAIDFLEDMIKEADDDGYQLKVVSAYRSFDEQNFIKGQFTQVYGEGANTFSADQGFSEHQLGTTVDLTVTEVGGTFSSFADTEAYTWLLNNAYKYGFILSYPEGNQFYIFEPWHWRFVGVELARDLHRNEANFYDWEQRKIDEYLIDVFD